MYGLPLHRYLSRGTPLYNTILCHAPFSALEIYAFAASEQLEDLAVAASAYTLNAPFHLTSKALVKQMGTQYMWRLFQLHGMRIDTLKSLLDLPIYPHIATRRCSAENRKQLSKCYGLTCRQVYYDASPDIETHFAALIDTLDCQDCKALTRQHVDEMCTEWLLLQRTI
ncbi:hypothetical protein BC629DRAFT_645597 [Irpex lacteus]|nr:hypothetical protein BC629DRAFT_645597 [Irpex lacteus]